MAVCFQASTRRCATYTCARLVRSSKERLLSLRSIGNVAAVNARKHRSVTSTTARHHQYRLRTRMRASAWHHAAAIANIDDIDGREACALARRPLFYHLTLHICARAPHRSAWRVVGSIAKTDNAYERVRRVKRRIRRTCGMASRRAAAAGGVRRNSVASMARHGVAAKTKTGIAGVAWHLRSRHLA